MPFLFLIYVIMAVVEHVGVVLAVAKDGETADVVSPTKHIAIGTIIDSFMYIFFYLSFILFYFSLNIIIIYLPYALLILILFPNLHYCHLYPLVQVAIKNSHDSYKHRN